MAAEKSGATVGIQERTEGKIMSDCTREAALSIAIKYLGEQYLGQLEVDDKLPSGIYIGSSEFDNSWSIYVPQRAQHSMFVGGGRYILISKKTGKIICDQVVGD